jgi:hypothetical protein
VSPQDASPWHAPVSARTPLLARGSSAATRAAGHPSARISHKSFANRLNYPLGR